PTVDGLAETTTQVMKSLLSVQTEPAGATVTLRRGDRVVATGPSPFAQTLDEGEYALSVEHPDYRTIGERVRVHAGKVYVVIVEMSQGHFLGYLQVVSDPPGANVFIDGSEQGAAGQTPFRSVVDTGTHHLTLERAGFAPEERDVEVDVGAEFSLNVRLARVDYGRLRVVASQPHARVLVDGEEVGEVPYEGQVSPGSHEVEVEADGMKTFSADVTIERGQLTPMRVRLRPRPGRSAAWTTLILGVGSAGAGLYLGMRGTDLRDQLSAERDAGTLASDDPRILRGRLFYYGADVAYGLGALLGVFSIYYFLRDPLPDSDGRVLEPRDWALSPSFDRDGAGATLTGRF
ncbi:MAG: PEGA domain-containing protein, partial [Myxococcales bacterium]|nr:PEGA domain-containing protein [Myxococcales bacterium]